MRGTFQTIVAVATLAFFTLFLVAPMLAPFFGLSLVIAAAGSWRFEIPFCLAYLAVAWKVYAALASFTFAFFVTFVYQNCCVTERGLFSHLWHHGAKKLPQELLEALFWPYTWYRFDRMYRRWNFTLAEAVMDAIEYWWSGWRRRPPAVAIPPEDIDRM